MGEPAFEPLAIRRCRIDDAHDSADAALLPKLASERPSQRSGSSSAGKEAPKLRRMRGLDSRYRCSRVIGSGSFGKVWEAVDTLTGCRVAIKKMRVTADDYSSDGFPISALREISILRFLSRERSIVRLIASEFTVLERRFYVFMIFELMQQSLHDALYKGPQQKQHKQHKGGGPRLKPEAIRSIMYQVLRGVAVLHSHGILHRDLKPQNILIGFDNATAKIADFGLSRHYYATPRPYTQEVVSLWYRSPEILLGERSYTTAVDVFSAGVILFELLLGEPPFVADTEIQMCLEIFRVLGTPTEQLWPGVSRLQHFHAFPQWTPRNLAHVCPSHTSLSALDLLSKLLSLDPLQRISAKASLGHPFFMEEHYQQ